MGHSSFRIKTKNTLIVTDPYDGIGIKMPRVKADIVTISHAHHDHNFIEAVEGTEAHPEPFVISGAGEYEVSGVFILGIGSYHDASGGSERGKNTIYLITAEGLRLCHLGDLGYLPEEKVIEELSQADILLVPVGGTYTIGAKKAAEIINQIEPEIVIPMHYKIPGLNLDLASVDDFLEEMGIEKGKKLPKLSLRKETLPEEREVVVLEKKS